MNDPHSVRVLEQINKLSIDMQQQNSRIQDLDRRVQVQFETLKSTVTESIKTETNHANNQNQPNNQLVTLNVGGTIYTTSMETLLCTLPESHMDPDNEKPCESLFNAMFSGRFDIQLDEQNRVFLDRDGKTFRHILNYLRTGGDTSKCNLPLTKPTVVQDLIIEADFYNLVALKEVLIRSTNSFQESILLTQNHAEILTKWLPPNSKWKLRYKGTRDGFRAKDFHNLCDKKGETVTIIQTENDSVFGGYTPISWVSSNTWKFDSKTFIFSMRTPRGDTPVMIPHAGNEHQNKYSICDHASYGPSFGKGSDFYISDDCNLNTQSYTNPNHSFQLDKLMYNTEEAKNYLCGSYNFKVKEIEVFIRK